MRSFSNTRTLLLLIITSFLFAACSTADHSRVRTESWVSVHFIDVGLGDSVLLKLPHEKTMLVDAGNSDAGPELVKYLKSIGVKRIDHLILTHPHDDHVGGAFNILSQFDVGNIYDTGFDNDDSMMHGCYLTFFRGDPSRYSILKAGETFSFGGVRIDVISPLLPPTGDLNEDSIVLRFQYGKISALLTGDMGTPGERRLLNEGIVLKSNVLKVGHHGDADASSDEFLAAVGPHAVIISVGADDQYSRPKAETLSRLKNSGAIIYRTDRDGNIILRTDGKVFSLHTEKPLNGESQ